MKFWDRQHALSHRVCIVSWQEGFSKLQAIRTAVFIHEQKVPEALEWDEFDSVSLHALALNIAGEPVGTARLLPDGHIGRMAVLKEWRGQGYGSAMLQRLLEELKRQSASKAVLNAQISAAGFYERFGFQISGNQFMEAGIPHIRMTLRW